MFARDIRQLAREATLVGGWLLALLVFLALLTYSPHDPAWSTASEDVPEIDIQNSLGVLGAHLADILFSNFGYSAYLLCAALFVAMHALLGRHATEKNAERLGVYWCATGVLFFIVASAGLEYIHFSQSSINDELPSGAGGGVGDLTGTLTEQKFGKVGATLLLLGVWMISLSLSAALSWFTLFEIIGEYCERGVLRFYAIIKKQMEQRQVAKLQKKQAESARKASADAMHGLLPPKPKIDFIVPAARKLRNDESKSSLPLGFGNNKSASDSTNDKPKTDSASANSTSTTATTSATDTESLPPSSLLDVYQQSGGSPRDTEAMLSHNSQLIEQTLKSYGVSVQVLAAHPGPVITRYDIQPDVGVKGAQIVSLMRDMARALSVASIRVLETIPGKNCMGLEIPNADRATVYLSEIIADKSYQQGRQILPLALGKDATGAPVVADLATMPHLLAAGATGSGKSVCINAMLLSLLYSAPPSQLKLLLIDPKMLELASYEGIPHLLAPVVTDVSLAPAALNWAVEEMENRYRLMSSTGVRNIVSYNRLLEKGEMKERPLPYIVVVIDELADLMMSTGKKVETTISRLAQKARAAGIHLILATQRPSVDVITGLIKANVPSRIAFQVAAKVDSRTIIDQMGADVLLGMGDMLYLPPGVSVPIRVHGAFVSDEEVMRVAKHWQGQHSGEYEVDFSHPVATGAGVGNAGGGEDELYAQAVEAVLASNRPSISLVQRKLRIGYNRAARLIEDMEAAGVVSAADESGVRKILQSGE